MEQVHLLIKNAKVFNSYLKKFISANVAVKDGKFYYIDRKQDTDLQTDNVIDAKGSYMIPGLTDIHMHIESSMATPGFFDETTKRKLVQRLYEFLEPGGYLIIGSTENIDRSAVPLGRFVKINHDISQKNHMHFFLKRQWIHQIKLSENHLLAQFFFHLIHSIGQRHKITVPPPDRQCINLLCTINTVHRAVQYFS